MLYHNTNSLFHYLNGFTKLFIFVVIVPFLLFFADSFLIKLLLFSLVAVLLIFTKPSKVQLIVLYPAFVVSLFMSVTQFFGQMATADTIYFYIDLKMIDFAITSTNIFDALNTLLELLGTSFGFFIFLFTTTPKDIIAGMRKARIPEVVVLIFSITLRFWGVMIDDVKKIIDAQYARGVNFKDKNIGKRIKNFLSILAPLIYILIKRTQITGLALTLKGFGNTKKRTVYYNPALSLIDKQAITLSLILCMFIVGYSFFK